MGVEIFKFLIAVLLIIGYTVYEDKISKSENKHLKKNVKKSNIVKRRGNREVMQRVVSAPSAGRGSVTPRLVYLWSNSLVW
jgi:hypothetical protein